MYRKIIGSLIVLPALMGTTWECQQNGAKSLVITETPVTAPGVSCKQRRYLGVVNKAPSEFFSGFALEADEYLEELNELLGQKDLGRNLNRGRQNSIALPKPAPENKRLIGDSNI